MKRFIQFSVSVFFVCAFVVTAQPVNPNGSFEDATIGEKTGTDVTGWTILFGGAGNAIFEITDGDFYDGSQSMEVQLLAMGTNPWDIQLVNEPINVAGGTEYKYSIWARADYAGVVLDFTVGAPVTYAEYGRLGQAVLSDQWQEFTFNFTTDDTTTVVRAPIHLGEAANSAFLEVPIYLDNLVIEEAGAAGVERENQLPSKFSLSQNYPNPFNPSTKIEYSIPHSAFISLKVYNLLGDEVATLYEGTRNAGNYSVEFNGSGLPSGIYFYRLSAGSIGKSENYMETKKFILLK